MKISQMDPTEAGQRMYEMYMDAHKNYDPEKHGDHPSQDFKRWVDIAATGGENSEEQIQSQDDETVQPKKSASGNSGAGGNVPAQDGRYVVGLDGVPKFITPTGAILVGDAALEANAKQANPARARAMAQHIKGY
jgi:hypothetical protein